jgi:hypothetical protein
MKVKNELLNLCKTFVNKRLQTVQETISSNQNALESEAKSSAGDKHETGRAMLQLEMEKVSQQLAGILEMNEILSKIDITKNSEIAHLGSIIFTEKSNYFLSISGGQFSVSGVNYFAISTASPIGKMLLGKQENDEIVFNGNRIKIQKIM